MENVLKDFKELCAAHSLTNNQDAVRGMEQLLRRAFNAGHTEACANRVSVPVADGLGGEDAAPAEDDCQRICRAVKKTVRKEMHAHKKAVRKAVKRAVRKAIAPSVVS